jgi:hypothetical protein
MITIKRYIHTLIQISLFLCRTNFINNRATLVSSFILKHNPILTRSYHNKDSDSSFDYNESNYKIPKKMICISPGGFKGFYLTGIIAFIKDNYDISDYIFSGASAGSWNALILAFKGNVHTFLDKILGNKTKISKEEKINDFELNIKRKVLENFNNSEFELNKIYIGVTTIHPNGLRIPLKIHDDFLHNHKNNSAYFIRTSIFHNFTNLEDVLDCCIASSHVPLITGGLINKYRNYYTFDGGFSHYPYYDLITPDLIIKPDMWDIKKKTGFKIEDYTTLLNKEKYDFLQLYEQGYNDTLKNRDFLDKIFLRKMT